MENTGAVKPRIFIRPSRGWVAIDFKELWRYRELLLALTVRDIKIRYKQTFFGVTWAIFKPFVTMVVFSLFFGKMMKVETAGVPYPIFSYSGLLLWQYFSQAIENAGNSLNTSENLIKKIYFPRLIIPMSSTFAGLLDYAIAGLVLLGMMVYYRYPVTANLLLLPLSLLLTWLLAIGVGLWFSALNVEYKDIRHALPFFIQIGLFISPVIYPGSLLGKYQWVGAINPMTGLIEAHRAAFLGGAGANPSALLFSFAITILFLFSGLYYFRRMERTFADIL
ncbi:MAG: ABC transporter permease [Candidatus Omnitrophota bacterium]|nr:ABC transporter permease [Candidatus Omnitrophota bacterium]